MHTVFTHITEDGGIETDIRIEFTISKYRPARIYPVDKSHPPDGGELCIASLLVVEQRLFGYDGARVGTVNPFGQSIIALTSEFEVMLDADKEFREHVCEACYKAAAAMPVGKED